jgi:hypothetical protein
LYRCGCMRDRDPWAPPQVQLAAAGGAGPEPGGSATAVGVGLPRPRTRRAAGKPPCNLPPPPAFPCGPLDPFLADIILPGNPPPSP